MAENRPELSLVAIHHYNEDDKEVDASTSSDTTSESDSETDSSSESSDTSSVASDTGPNRPRTSFYKSAHWTSDGTTIIASSYNSQISSFLVPENLLHPRDQPLTLNPYRTLQLAEPTNVLAPAPYFDIRFPNTDHFLVAPRDHPLHLYQALPPTDIIDSNHQPPLSSYPLISPTTEAYVAIHSIAWPSPGTHFYAGTRDLIAEFDITRPGPPTTRVPTIPSRRHIRKGNGVGMKGVVSALGAQPNNSILAAGTWTRWVGLYDIARSGECVATWNIANAIPNGGLDIVPPPPPQQKGAATLKRQKKLASEAGAGAGLTQTTWSPCGRYLLLNERQSTGLLVYDVRGTNKLLCFLAGRDAQTHQRLDCDVFRGLDAVGGFEVWAGSQDGTVQVWEGVGNVEGCQWPSWEFSAADGGGGGGGDVPAEAEETSCGKAPAVGSVGLHCSGSVVATCSGGWSVSDDQDAHDDVWSGGGRKMEASSLKLWSIGSGVDAQQQQQDMEVDNSSRGEPGESTFEVVTGAKTDNTDEVEMARLRVTSALESLLEVERPVDDEALEETKASATEKDANLRTQDPDIDISMDT